jgi:hypothetical protein
MISNFKLFLYSIYYFMKLNSQCWHFGIRKGDLQIRPAEADFQLMYDFE